MLTRKAKLLLSLTTATPLLFAGCTDNGIFNPLADAAGTYQLTVYAGKTLPAHYVIQPNDPQYPNYQNGATFDVVDGRMVLNSNGTYTETNNYVFTPTGQASSTSSYVSQGVWTLNGNTFTLSSQSENRYVTGTLDVNTINYQEPNSTGGYDSFEYKR
ncbi:MAG: hypothetical protein M3P12_08805 [Gemmatimonadota bacterium]|nr:hypothetical protein [Gemmatimonadota bacterium]